MTERTWTFLQDGEPVGWITATGKGEYVNVAMDGVGEAIFEENQDFSVPGFFYEEVDGKVSVVWLGYMLANDYGFDVDFEGAKIDDEVPIGDELLTGAERRSLRDT